MSASLSPLYSNTPVSEPPPCATSHLTPVGTMADENPFHDALDICPLTPIPDFHLQDDSGPSEPISWAFQRQALDNPFDMDPRSSPLGAFGEENTSSPPRPLLPSPTAISEGHIDLNLLKLSVAAPTLPTIQNPVAHSPMTTRTVTQASTHPLSLLSTARPSFIFDTFLSGGLLKAASTTPTTLSVGEASAPSSDDAPVATATQHTHFTTSPCRSLVATAIMASLTDAVSTPASMPMPVPPSSTAAPPPAIPPAQSLSAVAPPVPLPAPPLEIETRPAQKPTNTTLPKELSMQPWGCGKGRGSGEEGEEGEEGEAVRL